jgi:hypothetical protein
MEGDSKNPGSDRGGTEEEVAPEKKSTSSWRELRKVQKDALTRASDILKSIKDDANPEEPPTQVDIPRPPPVPTETKKKRPRQRTR